MGRAALGLLAAWGVLWGTACSEASPGAAAAGPPGTAGSAPASDAPPASERGEALFREHECGGCHEYAALPGLIVRPLAGLRQRYTLESLSAFLANPPPPMPSFPLDEDERRALAAYLLATYP